MKGYVRWLRSHVGHAPLLLVGAGAIIHRDGKVLLQRRADDGTWAIHGGCVEMGESTEEAAIREVREELGITPLSLEFYSILSGKDMFIRYPNGDEAYIVSVTYFCDRFSGEIWLDPAEVEEVQWFDADMLPDNIHAPIDVAILRDLKGFLQRTGRLKPPESVHSDERR